MVQAKKTGIELIAEERQRQVDKEGYTAEHDALHTDGDLALAAAIYATPFRLYIKNEIFANTINFDVADIEDWRLDLPREGNVIKDNSAFRLPYRLKQLAKAGALIAAEIDRLQTYTP